MNVYQEREAYHYEIIVENVIVTGRRMVTSPEKNRE